MAPRQLQLELNEVDMTADKGSKRVRADRADESSMQGATARKNTKGTPKPPSAPSLGMENSAAMAKTASSIYLYLHHSL
eukprot:scaffold9836_cov97-Isochrysis_galbana.AAC.1